MFDRVAQKGEPSRVIDQALKFYMEKKGRSNLRARLKVRYRARFAEIRVISSEWFSLDEEVWSGKGR